MRPSSELGRLLQWWQGLVRGRPSARTTLGTGFRGAHLQRVRSVQFRASLLSVAGEVSQERSARQAGAGRARLRAVRFVAAWEELEASGGGGPVVPSPHVRDADARERSGPGSACRLAPSREARPCYREWRRAAAAFDARVGEMTIAETWC